MERIRKALDLARLERNQAPLEPVRLEQVAEPQAAQPEPPTAGPEEQPHADGVILYTQTRCFTPSAEALERNRILGLGASDPASAAFRMLRTQVLQRMNTHGWRTLGIFSPSASDGKTTTAINLAAHLATDHAHTVLLVDLDFKRPSIARRLDLEPEVGSDDALTGKARVQDCLYHPEGFDRFVIMPARGTLANSSEVLASPRSRELVRELRARYPERLVIYDLPPVLTADDALAFAPLLDCGLVVVSESHTRRKDLLRTMELLRNTPIVGTVLNRAAETMAGY